MKKQVGKVLSLFIALIAIVATLSIASTDKETFYEKKEVIKNHILNVEAIEDVEKYDYNYDNKITITDYTLLRVEELRKEGLI